MPHALMKPNEDVPNFEALLLSARYRCRCQTKEVLTIQTVIDVNMPDHVLHLVFQRLIDDLRFEIAQHIKPDDAQPLTSPTERSRHGQDQAVDGR